MQGIIARHVYSFLSIRLLYSKNVYSFFVHLSTLFQKCLQYFVRLSTLFQKFLQFFVCLSVYLIPKYTNKQIWLSLSDIQMSRILVSVCPQMSRNFVSVCPHMSRNFVSLSSHMILVNWKKADDFREKKSMQIYS